jgi:hypothetical protein
MDTLAVFGSGMNAPPPDPVVNLGGDFQIDIGADLIREAIRQQLTTRNSTRTPLHSVLSNTESMSRRTTRQFPAPTMQSLILRLNSLSGHGIPRSYFVEARPIPPGEIRGILIIRVACETLGCLSKNNGSRQAFVSHQMSTETYVLFVAIYRCQ